MDKQTVIERINFKSFYQSFIPSLKLNGRAESMGLCPFHDDKNPSLSVNIESGLYNCFACGAKGDVFQFYQDIKKVDFQTAVRELAAQQGIIDTPPIKGKVVATYEYKALEGKLLYIKERIEPGRNGRSKEFVFKHLAENNKWQMGRGGDPVPYNLPLVVKSKYIFVVEGEAKADFLTNQFRLTATCLDSGAQSPFKDSYMQYFQGMEKVVILPDNDTPGKQYANKIISALHGKAKAIKIVELPGLPEAGDIIDWVKIEGNTKDKLLSLVKEAPEWIPPKEEPGAEPETPLIPLDYDALPSFLKEIVEMISPTTLAPDEFTTTALLSSMASAIGTRAYIQMGRRVFYPSIWGMLIAPSSDFFKSTAIREARSPILKIDKEYEAIFLEATEDYNREFKKYETQSKEDKISKAEPVAPIRREIDFSDDETLESFYQTLHDNKEGGLLAFDEIGGWIEGFDKYRNGNSEKRRWLTIFDNHPIKYKRKTDTTHLVIDKPFVSIIGGITSNTFNSIFKGGMIDIENGFLPRFIFCKTPKLIKRDDSFLRADIASEKLNKIYQLFKSVTVTRQGAVELSPEALEMLNDWYLQHQKQKDDRFYPDELSPFWRRLEGYLLKFALVFHQFKTATGEEAGNLISIQTLTEAMSLTEYYKGQAEVVVRELCQGKDGRVFDDLIALIKKMGGEAKLRDIQHAKAYWRGKGEYLKEVLGRMQAEGLIRLEEYTSGGRKGLKAILHTKNQ
jgi:putative DNA primase/helicase